MTECSVIVPSELAHLVHVQDQLLAISFNLMKSKMYGSVSHMTFILVLASGLTLNLA